MKDDKEAAYLRQELDEILKKWRRVPARSLDGGWIRNIREALGMTAKELGARMGLSPNGVSSLELSEMRDTITVESLRRAAKALDCHLVYALVPRRPLSYILEKRRRQIALADLGPLLYDKRPGEFRALISAYAEKIKRERVWRQEKRTDSAGNGASGDR